MAIPEFGNALPQLGHNMAQIVGLEVRKDNYKRKILSRSVLVLDSSVVREPAHIAGDLGSNPGPG